MNRYQSLMTELAFYSQCRRISVGIVTFHTELVFSTPDITSNRIVAIADLINIDEILLHLAHIPSPQLRWLPPPAWRQEQRLLGQH